MTIQPAFYIVYVIGVGTGLSLTFVLEDAFDISNDKSRYNEFIIDAVQVFSPLPAGQYLYYVHESTNGVNHGDLIEHGKLNLIDDSTTIINKYEQATEIRQYNG